MNWEKDEATGDWLATYVMPGPWRRNFSVSARADGRFSLVIWEGGSRYSSTFDTEEEAKGHGARHHSVHGLDNVMQNVQHVGRKYAPVVR